MTNWEYCKGVGQRPIRGLCPVCGASGRVGSRDTIKVHKNTGGAAPRIYSTGVEVADWVTLPSGASGQLVGIDNGIGFVRTSGSIEQHPISDIKKSK